MPHTLKEKTRGKTHASINRLSTATGRGRGKPDSPGFLTGGFPPGKPGGAKGWASTRPTQSSGPQVLFGGGSFCPSWGTLGPGPPPAIFGGTGPTLGGPSLAAGFSPTQPFVFFPQDLWNGGVVLIGSPWATTPKTPPKGGGGFPPGTGGGGGFKKNPLGFPFLGGKRYPPKRFDTPYPQVYPQKGRERGLKFSERRLKKKQKKTQKQRKKRRQKGKTTKKGFF